MDLRAHGFAGDEQHALESALLQVTGGLHGAAIAEHKVRRLQERHDVHGFTSIAPAGSGFSGLNDLRFSSQPQNVHSLFKFASGGKKRLAR